jgi:aspartate/methionine/tyrosine aminotransferase
MMHHSPYMEWAKARPHSAVDLGISNVLGCRLEDLPGARDALDFDGRNDDGYPPLLEAVAARYQVAPDQVATAIGTSGANFLACLALLTAGDEVLVETPAYDPLLAAPRTLGARVNRFERRIEDRFAVDPAAVKAALTASTRLVILTHPHNPTGGLTSDEALTEIARLADRQGALVLVDEVYLDAAKGCGARPATHLAGNIISTNSLTKSYGLAPLRCGWAIAPLPSVNASAARATSSTPAGRFPWNGCRCWRSSTWNVSPIGRGQCWSPTCTLYVSSSHAALHWMGSSNTAPWRFLACAACPMPRHW